MTIGTSTYMGHPHQWFGGKTYAQHGDDLIFLNLFYRLGISNPSYLDIGAHHPFNISNTALLYERGSCGINVEPDPSVKVEFDLHRPMDINLIGVGVAPEAGSKPLYIKDDRGRNSFVDTQHAIHVRMTPVMTVAEIIEKHAPNGFPDLLTVDTEGMDLDILRSMDFTQDAPKVVCAEAVGRDVLSMLSLMSDRGYSLQFRAGSNLIFARGL